MGVEKWEGKVVENGGGRGFYGGENVVEQWWANGSLLRLKSGPMCWGKGGLWRRKSDLGEGEVY